MHIKGQLSKPVTMAVRRFIDIGANLTDSMYSGEYHGKKVHEPDLKYVLERAWETGIQKIIITGGSLDESQKALGLAQTDSRLYSTVGTHPTRCDNFEKNDPQQHLNELSEVIRNGGSKIVAVGEIGLDFDRTQFCSEAVQLKHFERQLGLSEKFNLPLFLHCRAAFDPFIEILSRNKTLPGGVVHSFDGKLEHAMKIIDLGYYIGINGCSLKTQENLDVVKAIPTDRIMLETDCPWCEVRPSHAGSKLIQTKFSFMKKEKWHKDLMVKSRNEPATIVQILEIIAGIKCESIDALVEQIYRNTDDVFFTRRKEVEMEINP